MNKRAWLICIAVALALLAGVVGCILQQDQPAPQIPVAAATITDAWIQSAVSATANGDSIDVMGAGAVALQVSGTYTTATTSFEGTANGTNWVSIQCVDTADGSLDTSTTANGIWTCNAAGLTAVRAPVTWTSGTSVSVYAFSVESGTVNTADVDLANTETVAVSGALTVNDPISVTVGGQAVQLDDTDKMAVSLYGKDAAAGDIAVNASATGNWETDIHVAGQALQMDDTDKVAVSLYGSGSGAGDTAVNTDASGNVHILPFQAVTEIAVVELVGADEEVNTSDYGGSVALALGGSYSGYIDGVCIFATEDGTGAVQDSAGVLLFLDADPATTAGDTAITNAERLTVLGQVTFYASDWQTDATGGSACKEPGIPFHALSNIYALWFHTDATDLNDAAGDDESAELEVRYQRHS